VKLTRCFKLALAWVLCAACIAHAKENEIDVLSSLVFVFSWDGYAAIELVKMSALPRANELELKTLFRTNRDHFARVELSDEFVRGLDDRGFVLGKVFTIYEPKMREFHEFQLWSFALFPSGDGWVSGVAGILLPVNDGAFELPAGGTSRPIAVGYWKDYPLIESKAHLGKPDTPLADKDEELLLNALLPNNEVTSVEIWKGEEHTLILLTEREKVTLRKIARCFLLHENTLTPISFAEEEKSEFVLHDRMMDSDIGPARGVAFFLPDFDQSGYPEVFNQNTVSEIYDLRPSTPGDNIRIEKLTDVYYGP